MRTQVVSQNTTSMAKLRHNEIRWIDVPLGSIRNHSAYDSKTLSIMFDDYTLRYAKGELSPVACRQLILYHPILVVSAGKENMEYECLVGYRTLDLARLVLNPEDIVTVGKLPALSDDDKEQICYADLLLSAVALSLSKPAKTLAKIFSAKHVVAQMVPLLLPKINKSANHLASIIGISPATLMRAKKTIKEESLTHPLK